MPEAEYIHNAGVHLLTWKELQLGVRVDRLRDRSDGLSGEITVKTTLPGMNPHIHQARLNLLSTVSRRQLANQLRERLDDSSLTLGLDWNEIVEQTCITVVTEHRQGEPVYNVADIPKRDALKYRVFPLLAEGQANMLYGAGGSLKSYIAIYLMVLLDGMPEHNGFQVEPGPTLFLDYETDKFTVKERKDRLVEGIGMHEPRDSYYRYCQQPLADDIEEVQRFVVEKGIQAIIIDSMGSAVGGDTNKEEFILAYYRALRSLKITTLTIDHLNKEGKLYGNIYKFNQSRNIWEARKVQEPDGDKVEVGLFHRKANDGKLLKPIGLQASFAPEAVVIKRINVLDVPELSDNAPIKDRMTNLLLRSGLLSVGQIAEELNEKEETIRRTLDRYRDRYFTEQMERWAVLRKASADTVQDTVPRNEG